MSSTINNLTISTELQQKLPNFNVIAYTMEVDNNKTEAVNKLLQEVCQIKYNLCELTDVVNIPLIKEARDGYKKLGKDPSHTRLACEALLRRVIRDGSLYRLGDLIDLGNIVSIMTNRSICVADMDKIKGDITIRIGTKEDDYDTINRGKLNVDKIPLYVDEIGFFGNPTSDSPRTMITETTKRILIMMICFNQVNDDSENYLLSVYQKYANAKNIKKIR